MRYGPHATSNDRAPASRLLRPSSTFHRPAKSDPTEHQSGASVTARLSRPCKLLRLNGLAITMHNVGHIEWRFYSVKPATGGEGVRPGYTTATATHSPPQIFFRQLAPSQLTPPVAMLHSPTSGKTSWLACLSFTGAHTSHTKFVTLYCVATTPPTPLYDAHQGRFLFALALHL